MTEDDLKRAEELLDDPDAEDCERFASWFGSSLIAEVRQAAAALAKLQAERDEAIDAQFTVDENCVSIGWEEVAAMWRSRATHAEARAEKAEAERDHNWKEYLDERSARMAENNRNHRLTEALQPFAVWADKMPDVVPELSADIMNVLRFAVANGHLTGAHFRAASRALGG